MGCIVRQVGDLPDWPSRRRTAISEVGSAGLALAVMPLTVLAPVGVPRARAATTELFFSEYIEGSSNNKALEIFNGTGAAVDLGAGGYNVQMFFNGSATAGLTINLTGTRGRRRRVRARPVGGQRDDPRPGRSDQRRRAGSTATTPSCSARAPPSSTSSARSASTPAPSGEPGSPARPTTRCAGKATVCQGDTNGADVFDPAVEWDGFAIDTFDGLGAHRRLRRPRSRRGHVDHARQTARPASPGR